MEWTGHASNRACCFTAQVGVKRHARGDIPQQRSVARRRNSQEQAAAPRVCVQWHTLVHTATMLVCQS